MKVSHRATRDEVEQERSRRYLAAWPLPRQIEAMQDREAGRPEKWERMQADFQAIRHALPYPPAE